MEKGDGCTIFVSILYRTLANREKTYSYAKICPQQGQNFCMRGLCSHNPMQEGVHGEDTSDKASGAELRRMQRERDRHYQHHYQRQLRKNATPEFKERTRIHNFKQKPSTKLREQTDKAAFKHYCGTCKVSSRNAVD
jgi:hypothetical protein